MQCLADAHLVLKRPVLPKLSGDCRGGPYWLVQAQKGCEGWPKGWYGLVQMNDPDFIWEGEPIPEPLFRKKDEKAWKNWWKMLEKIECNLGPIVGYQLVASCMQAGYRPEKHGYRVIWWLMNRIGRMLEKQKRS